MKPRTTVILLVFLTGLCFAYWAMLHYEETQRTQVTAAKQMFSFSPENVKALAIQRIGEEASVGERGDDGVWTITKPFPVLANQQVWNRVADALSALTNQRTLAEHPTDLKTYDLTEPCLKVKATIASGEELLLQFGAADPTQTKRFALAPNGSLILVNMTNFQELDRRLLDLRDRYLVRAGSSGISRIEYTRIRRRNEQDGLPPADYPVELKNGVEQVTVLVEKDVDGVWNVVKPFAGLANQEMVTALVSAVQFGVGDEYVDQPESMSDYQLDPPGARVRVYAEPNAAAQELYFGGVLKKNDQEFIYVKRSDGPSVFLTDAFVLASFPDAPGAFRERRLLTRAATDLIQITCESPDKKIVLDADKERGWRMTQPIDVDTNQAAVSDFISLLKTIEADSFLDEAKPEFGLDTPRVRISLTFGSDNTSRTISVGNSLPDSDAYFAKQDNGAVVAITKAKGDLLNWTPWQFREKQLLRFDAKQTVQISLALDGIEYVLAKKEQRWRVLAPEAKIIESQSDADMILDALKGLKVEAIESETTPEDVTPYGLAQPTLSVRLTLANEKNDANRELGPILIGGAAVDNSQQRFAKMSDRKEIFRIPQQVVSDIREAMKGVKDASSTL